MKRTCIVTINSWLIDDAYALKNDLHGKTFATIEDVRKFARAEEGVHVYDMDVFFDMLNEDKIDVDSTFFTPIMFEGEAENPFNFD